jgi:hypothetical protein
MRYIPVVLSILIIGACSKTNDTKCIVKNDAGQSLYEVTGTQKCEDQINKSTGEYCDCNTQN